MDLLELAERCEKASGPDRELDAAIAAVSGYRVVDEGHPLGRCCYDRNGISIVLPRYSASLDAAMTLVPADWHTSLRGINDSWHVSMNPTSRGPIAETFAFSATPALAAIAASLRARIVKAPTHD